MKEVLLATQKRNRQSDQPAVVFEEGRLWFSRETERRFYFVLTAIMLIVGILYRLELF